MKNNHGVAVDLRKLTVGKLSQWMEAISYPEALQEQLVTDIWMDSRLLKFGDIFVALRGEKTDGHDHIEAAFEAGACVAIVDEVYAKTMLHSDKLIVVKDPLLSLQNAAREYRRYLGFPIIAVTGSSGKTTTTHGIKKLLETLFVVGTTKDNWNNHIGLPLSILRLTGEEDMAVFEIGANHCGEIAELADILEPDMGVIANVGYAHIGYFGSLEKTAEAKFELARAIQKNGGLLLLNGDDQESVRRNEIDCVPAMYFGTVEHCGIRVENVQCNKDGCYSFDLDGETFDLTVPGMHMVYSILPGIFIALQMGLDRKKIKQAVHEISAVHMRGGIETVSGRRIIVDCYNANPSSMSVALKMLKDIPTDGKRVAVLGTMGELGAYESELHIRLAEEVFQNGIDCFIVVGSCATCMADAARAIGMASARVFCCETVEEAGEVLVRETVASDLILLKGSRSVELEKVIDIMKEALDA